MKIKAVLFDLDGTLLDTREFVYQAYEHSLSFHRLEVIKREELAPLIGQRIEVIYQRIAPTGDIKLLIESHFGFQAKNFHLVKSFPNILEVVTKLKKLDIKVGIVTTRLKNTPQTLKTGGLEPKLFDVIITGDKVTKPKPDPQGLFLALKKLKVKPSEALMVGDGAADIQMGKNAKVKTVGVTWGFAGKNIKKSKPDYIIDNIREFLAFL